MEANPEKSGKTVMMKIALVLLSVVLLLASYTFGVFHARTVISLPDAQWAEESEAAQAWREFTASLESAGARVFSVAKTERERIEGLLFLSQLATASLEMKAAKGSSSSPAFTNWMSNYRKFLGDSPDAAYHTAQVAKGYRYEVAGNRRDAEYLSFSLYGRQVNGWNRAAASISNKALRFDAEGNFRLIISATKPDSPGTDWLPLEDDIHMIMVRQYFHGRDGKVLADLSIRNLDAPAYERPTDDVVAKGLREAGNFFRETLDGAIALTDMLSGSPNDINPPPSYSADFGGVFYPTNDNDYYGNWYFLGDDEALVIEGAVPDAPYWAVSLQNRWMQSLDYKYHQTALNDQQIETENGRYRIIVSPQKPPSGNWLDTVGNREGLLSIRYQQSQKSEPPSVTLVKFSDLLPPG
jgi:hypothetical protein